MLSLHSAEASDVEACKSCSVAGVDKAIVDSGAELDFGDGGYAAADPLRISLAANALARSQ